MRTLENGRGKCRQAKAELFQALRRKLTEQCDGSVNKLNPTCARSDIRAFTRMGHTHITYCTLNIQIPHTLTHTHTPHKVKVTNKHKCRN